MLKHFNHWQLTDHHTISFPSSSLSSYANQGASKQFHSTHSFPPHCQFPIEHLSSSSSIPPPPPHHKPHSIRQVYSSSKIQLPRAGERARENAITDRQRDRHCSTHWQWNCNVFSLLLLLPSDNKRACKGTRSLTMQGRERVPSMPAAANTRELEAKNGGGHGHSQQRSEAKLKPVSQPGLWLWQKSLESHTVRDTHTHGQSLVQITRARLSLTELSSQLSPHFNVDPFRAHNLICCFFSSAQLNFSQDGGAAVLQLHRLRHKCSRMPFRRRHHQRLPGKTMKVEQQSGERTFEIYSLRHTFLHSPWMVMRVMVVMRGQQLKQLKQPRAHHPHHHHHQRGQ